MTADALWPAAFVFVQVPLRKLVLRRALFGESWVFLQCLWAMAFKLLRISARALEQVLRAKVGLLESQVNEIGPLECACAADGATAITRTAAAAIFETKLY